MSLFLQAYLGHLLADFVFQPGRLVIAKRNGMKGMLVHTGIVTLSTALVLWRSLAETWPIILVVGAAHLAIEHLSVAARRKTAASGLRLFLLDQGLHVISLVLVAVAFWGEVAPAIALWPTTLPTIAVTCGIATVAFMGSILAFEARVAILDGDSETNPILAFDSARLYGVVERTLALTVAVVSPCPVLGVLAFAPRIIKALLAPPRERTVQGLEAAMGLLLCTVVWFLIAGSTELGLLS